MLSGTVVKGKALGKDLGFPTANITIKEEYKIIPKYGSYIVSSEIDGAKVYGMMNIGVNPTFQTTRESIEVHFLDFNKIIYNKTIQVDLIARLRDEQKFDSIKALKEQLQRDEAATRRFLKDHQE